MDDVTADKSPFHEERHKFVVVDSSSRNKSLYPTPNKYEFNMDNSLHNVTSVEITQLCVPFASVLISPLSGNTFMFNDVLVEVPEGNYNQRDPTTLASAINNLVNNINSSVSFYYDIFSEKFYFATGTGDPTFQVDFTRSKALADIMGFERKLYVSDSATNQLRATFRKDTKGHLYHNSIVMQLNDYARVVSNNANFDCKAFCILSKQEDHPSEARCKHALVIPKHVFHPPLSKVSKLTVSFLDIYGNPYDFNNQDHHFELLFRFREPVLKRC